MGNFCNIYRGIYMVVYTYFLYKMIVDYYHFLYNRKVTDYMIANVHSFYRVQKYNKQVQL
mgnify:CR=1 FL=1